MKRKANIPPEAELDEFAFYQARLGDKTDHSVSLAKDGRYFLRIGIQGRLKPVTEAVALKDFVRSLPEPFRKIILGALAGRKGTR